ncbi:ribonuclease E activity regulator RraA [Deinococcus deserti]|uniref:4-hydroxy-4-methyl-2-oxoglutarate aldolase n=1 Tax=Deinococcus deserti (strain DSM 17065 / CIP 109153 / LMG 22923 / VCD115) TaxID=546414 RepID=C1CXY0_DEIDV|nr:ribonuclease E activity regulator RraA [Deinococcus deserti]ACO46936.2 putative ribonuclease activity regulator protein RraA [Deinococcus deserti VCD115]
MSAELVPAVMPTSDLSDAFPEAVVLPPVFNDYGGQIRFSGTVQTLRVHENNPLVRQTLETSGEGRVLVVDGGGSLNCALLGGQLGQLAVDHGWAGVVIHGCVRDVAELRGLPAGIRALAAHPRRSGKVPLGEVGVPIEFAGVRVHPGMTLHADEDGIVLVP